MALRVDGSTALVTGASSGIGAAISEELAAAGCKVLLSGRDPDRLAEVARRTGGRVCPADLADPAGSEQLVAAAGEVDVLVHSAGAGWAGQFSDMPEDRVLELTAVNLTAPMLLTRAALPGMVQRRRGHIVFVSSIAAVGVRGEEVYSATKAGLRAFATSLRYRAEPHGVGVSTVFPGAVRTPFFDRRGTPYDRRFPRMIAPEAVARQAVRAIERGIDEVYVPRWLELAVRVQGLFPGAFHRLARRFG